MPFNISEFSAELGKNGFARPAYFTVIINLPNALAGKYNMRGLPLRIEAAAMPGRSLIAAEQRYYGPVRRVPYTFAPTGELNLTIILSEDYREREVFAAWQDLMVGKSRVNNNGTAKGLFDAGYYETGTKGAAVEIHSYATSPMINFKTNKPTVVTQVKKVVSALGYDPSKILTKIPLPKGAQDLAIQSVSVVHLEEPYPINIADVPLGWADDGYARLQVAMQYRYFTEENFYTDISAETGSSSALGMLSKFSPVFSAITSSYGKLNSYASQAKDVISAFKKRI